MISAVTQVWSLVEYFVHFAFHTQDKDSVVTCLEEMRHSFQTGDYVTFSEVEVCILCVCVCSACISAVWLSVHEVCMLACTTLRVHVFITGDDRTEWL